MPRKPRINPDNHPNALRRQLGPTNIRSEVSRGQVALLPLQPLGSNGLDPQIQKIFDTAHAAESQVLAHMHSKSGMTARQQRAEEAWRRVAQCSGDALPRGLEHGEYTRLYAEQIMELGAVLRNDGWQDRVESVSPGSEAKSVALTILRRAMAGDSQAVLDLERHCVSTLFVLGLHVDNWLRDGLRYEVLAIPPEESSFFFKRELPGGEEPQAYRARTKDCLPKHDARNRWLYKQCCRGLPYKKILPQFLMLCREKGWKQLATVQGIRWAALKYAQLHNKPIPPRRQNL